jgi:ABC-2 type transport system ATP-binding protein
MAAELQSVSQHAIEVSALSYSHRSQRVLNDISFNVERGTTLCLLGANGSGKTTLLEILAGMRRPTLGHVNVLGLTPFRHDIQLRQCLGYVRDGASSVSSMRLSRLLAFVRSWHRTWNSELCDDLVARLQLDLSRRVRQLSRGQRTKLTFLLAVAPEPPVLLLDEPTAHLDPVGRETVLDVLLDFNRTREKVIVLATHLLEDVAKVGSTLCILNRGHLIFNGELNTFLSDAKCIDLEVSTLDVELRLPSYSLAQRHGARHWTIVLARPDETELQCFYDNNKGFVATSIRPATLLDAIRVTADQLP